MSFVSVTYALLLGGVFLLYWLLLNGKTKAQNALLLAASYWFYAWWDWRFLALIATTTLSTYLTALMCGRAIGNRRKGRGKVLTAANIVLNVGILCFFKYLNFFGENLSKLFELFGIGLDWVTLDILLPVGISFYTLQAIGYSVDVYRGDILPEKSLLNFATFIAFFPQLVAGPIERSRQLLPQIDKPRQWDYGRAVEGMRQILWGLAKKVILADFCGTAVDNILGDSAAAGSSIALAAMLFSFQIYGDFSGYSDMAIGSAKLLGIKLSVNFRYPFQSADVAELWQRWHISLMRWLRDYVYIPLGGSRRGTARTALNIAIVFLLSGLWHGAELTFVVWGAYWALLMIIERLTCPRVRKYSESANLKQLPRIFFVFVLFSIGVLIFRSETLPLFGQYASRIFSPSLFTVPAGQKALLICLIFYAMEWMGRHREFPISGLMMPRWTRWTIYWAIFITILWYQTLDLSQFIYFQF